MRLGWLGLVFFVGASLSSLEGCGFTRVAEDAGAGGELGEPPSDGAIEREADMAMPMASDPDMAMPTNSVPDLATTDLQPACSGCGCGSPALLVSVTNQTSSADEGGRVLQLALDANGVVAPCGPELTLANKLPAAATALGWIAPNGVAYGAREGLFLIDSAEDSRRWLYNTSNLDVPRAVFPLDRMGETVIAVGYDTNDFVDIRALYVIDPVAGKKLSSWDLTAPGSPIKIGAVDTIARSAIQPSHIFFSGRFSLSQPAATDVDVPFAEQDASPIAYWTSSLPGAYSRSIHTLRIGNMSRTVWLQATDNLTAPNAIYYANDTGSGPSLTGPLSCTLPQCATPFRSIFAVADPTASDRVIATCNSPTSTVGHVVRIDAAGHCTLLVDGSTLPPKTNPSKLAIVDAR
jgi:hypothetical protein